MRYLARITLILALLGGPFGCIPHAEERATTAAIAPLMAVDLDDCVKKAGSWSAYDACEAALTACARAAVTVGDYDTCSDKVAR